MSIIAFAAVLAIIFVLFSGTFAVSLLLIFLTKGRPLLWIAVASLSGFAFSWLTVRLGGNPSAIVTGIALFGFAQLASKPARGDVQGTIDAIQKDLRLTLFRYGKVYWWCGLVAMVVAGWLPTIQSCGPDGCRPIF